jgi:hypothetical protein
MLATPAVLPPPRVTAAYVYFHHYANRQDLKFNLGTAELVYRTDGALPEYPTGDVRVTPRIAGGSGSSYAISRSLHCYGASVYMDRRGRIGRSSALPGHRVRVRIPGIGWTRMLTVRRQRPNLLRGQTLGCGSDPKASVVLYNLTLTPKVEPGRCFLTADAGPYVDKLTWTGWGTSKAVGTGTYISDCASCGPKESKPATITLQRPVACAVYGTRVYRTGSLTKDPGTAAAKSADIPTGYPCGLW